MRSVAKLYDQALNRARFQTTAQTLTLDTKIVGHNLVSVLVQLCLVFQSKLCALFKVGIYFDV